MCYQKMMISYGLTGLNKSLKRTHRFCPMITHNCCTKDDENLSLEIWNSTARPKIEKKYKTYLLSLQYLLGFTDQGKDLEKDMVNSQDQKCRDAANQFNFINLTPEVVKTLFGEIYKSQKHIGEMRKSFFCLICDGRTSLEMKNFWETDDTRYQERMFFNKQFCEQIVERTILSNYYKIKYFKQYIEQFS